jgi:two-component system phosphate regulon sensor histidine kinase PhoR
MKKGSSHIIIIVTAITAALVGLITLQGVLLTDSYRQKEQAFDRNVLNALTSVAQRIEKDEEASKILNVAMTLPPPPTGMPLKRFKSLIGHTHKDSSPQRRFSWIITDSVRSDDSGRMRVEVFHSSGIDTMTSIIVQKSPQKKDRRQSFSYSYSTDESGIRVNANVNDSVMLMFRDTTRKRRGEIVAQVVDKLFLIETLPIEKRIDLSRLDSLLRSSLASVGITMDYSFRVTAGDGDSVKLSNDSLRAEELRTTPFKTRLFPNDILSPRYDLALFLPGRSSFVLSEMSLLLVMSLVFVSIIIVSFVYTIRVIVLQKRFSLSVIDFINNMTHEFKTPISTIALASEAIAKPEVLKSRPKVLKYNSLIVDENNRMKHQVEKILQMAVLEEGEFELKRTEVDIHQLIEQAVKNFTIPVEQKNGTLSAALNAKGRTVRGDMVHLSNIINNVLDNAVKYSGGIPDIRIATKDSDHSIIITVTDNGIGISKEDAERVFEKYYRVSTGNMHNVKGFGLGLSYVKLIVEAHNGSVALHSSPNKGTTVQIILPV